MRTVPALEAPSLPLTSASTLPFVSVIVPVRNEEKYIASTLSQLLEQDYDPERFEVIVADGESSDATAAIVQSFQPEHPNLHLVANPGRWSSAGRNAAIEIARGEILVLIDGHCALDGPNYLREIVDAFARSGADCLGRPQPLDIAQATPVQRAIALARSSRLGHHPDSHIYSSGEAFVKPQSVAIAYRRAVFNTVGLFDENFDACEDVEFNQRVDQAGLRCFFTNRVRVHYHPRGTLGGLFRQMQRYGRGRMRLLRKHRDSFTLPGFVPGFFVLGLLAGPLLALASSWLAWAYAGCVALYVAIVLLVSLTLALPKRELRSFPWLPLVFVVIHAGAGSGILLELLRPGRRPGATADPVPLLAPKRQAA
jgi:succinoglycan biosynthesis protein ExoA